MTVAINGILMSHGDPAMLEAAPNPASSSATTTTVAPKRLRYLPSMGLT